MAKWQLQEAKQKLSKVVDDAISSGPQTITRHGEEAVVVLSAAEYRRLTKAKKHKSFKDWILSGPTVDGGLEAPRQTDLPRDVDL